MFKLYAGILFPIILFLILGALYTIYGQDVGKYLSISHNATVWLLWLLLSISGFLIGSAIDSKIRKVVMLIGCAFFTAVSGAFINYLLSVYGIKTDFAGARGAWWFFIIYSVLGSASLLLGILACYIKRSVRSESRRQRP